MKLISSKKIGLLLASVAALSFASLAHAQTFTGGAGTDGNGNYDYNNGANWSSSSVPVTSNGATAIINDGLTASWYGGGDGGDFIVSNGGELEISNGTWQQVVNNNWIQLGAQGAGSGTGNGTILVNGGTFTQGTAGNNPFNVTGTGNVFTITSGTANFNSNLSSTSSGITYNFDGGLVNINGEIDYNLNNNILFDGATVNASLVTGVNNASMGILTFEAGTLNLSSGFGIYAPATTDPLNFTAGSTALINFEAVNAATVQNWVNGGIITYNGTTDASAFIVTATGANSATVTPVAAPEPSTYVLFGLSFMALLVIVRRRSSVAVRIKD